MSRTTTFYCDRCGGQIQHEIDVAVVEVCVAIARSGRPPAEQTSSGRKDLCPRCLDDVRRVTDALPFAVEVVGEYSSRHGVIHGAPGVVCMSTPAQPETPRREPSRCVIGEYCSRHGFIHGAEAEELRKACEQLVAEPLAVVGVWRNKLSDILRRIDARDSLAYVEASRDAAAVPE